MGDHEVKSEEGGSRIAEECKVEWQEILGSQAQLDPKHAKLFQHVPEFLENPSSLSKRARVAEPSPPSGPDAGGTASPLAGGAVGGAPQPY